MRIVPFPTPDEPAPGAQEIAALEAALAGGEAPDAEAWRELRSDIRSLAPPIDRGFERTLEQRLTAASEPAATEASVAAGRRRRGPLRWTAGARAPRLLALGAASALAALLLALLVVGPFAAGPGRTTKPRAQSVSGNSPAVAGAVQAEPAQSQAAPGAAAKEEDLSPAVPVVPSPGGVTGSPRVEQLGASMTLSGTPGEVQKLADGVGRIATAEGGYVTNSQVQVEVKGTSTATLQLSVPSGRLARTLAALGRLGSVRAETQSLQDITGAYDSARRALGDAVAERAALLRALAAASTQGQIESLHRRLALAAGAIKRASAAFAAISASAGNSAVEVTVLGEAHAAGNDLTLSRGLHDAGRVLTVALVIALIGLAALIPLLAVGLTGALGVRAWRRSARERALGES